MDCEESDVCWICLEGMDGAETKGGLLHANRLIHPCRCPRVVHTVCLAKWQLSQSGKSEEKYCRFCHEELPDWQQHLALPGMAAVEPVMSVHFNGTTHMVKVRPGEDGRKEFIRDVRELLRLRDHQDFSITFECKVPGHGMFLDLKGLSSYDAAVFCAAMTAVERQRIAAQKAARKKGASGGGASAAPSSANGGGIAASGSGSVGSNRTGGGGGISHLLHLASSQPNQTRPQSAQAPPPQRQASSELSRVNQGSSMAPVDSSGAAAAAAAAPSTAGSGGRRLTAGNSSSGGGFSGSANARRHTDLGLVTSPSNSSLQHLHHPSCHQQQQQQHRTNEGSGSTRESSSTVSSDAAPPSASQLLTTSSSGSNTSSSGGNGRGSGTGFSATGMDDAAAVADPAIPAPPGQVPLTTTATTTAPVNPLTISISDNDGINHHSSHSHSNPLSARSPASLAAQGSVRNPFRQQHQQQQQQQGAEEDVTQRGSRQEQQASESEATSAATASASRSSRRWRWGFSRTPTAAFDSSCEVITPAFAPRSTASTTAGSGDAGAAAAAATAGSGFGAGSGGVVGAAGSANLTEASGAARLNGGASSRRGKLVLSLRGLQGREVVGAAAGGEAGWNGGAERQQQRPSWLARVLVCGSGIAAD